MRYMVNCNGDESIVDSSAELERFLADLRRAGKGDIWVVQQLGERRGFEGLLYRVLGVNSKVDAKSMGVVFDGDRGFVTFLDEAADEFIGVDPERKPEEGTVRFVLATGEITEVPAADCASTDTAFDALRHFYQNGTRTRTLRWRKSV